MARREFSSAVKVEIIRRATRENVVYCEDCGCPTRRFDIDHTTADGLSVDKSKPLTAKDGMLLCSGSRETCHGRKTAEHDIPVIAQAKRREAAHVGATKAKGSIPKPASENDRRKREPVQVAAGVPGIFRRFRQG